MKRYQTGRLLIALLVLFVVSTLLTVVITLASRGGQKDEGRQMVNGTVAAREEEQEKNSGNKPVSTTGETEMGSSKEQENTGIEKSTTSKDDSTTSDSNEKKTLKNLLKTALEPVGNTMYIWGGGWNKEDTGAGDDARRIGVNPEWKKFALKQDSTYDFHKYEYDWGHGLDCSGYMGWVVYNIVNTKSGKKGYVTKAKDLAYNYAVEQKWGTYTDRSRVINYKPGDVMSSTCDDCGHVFLVLGTCSDGSLVIVHSSPPGVRISGTPTPDGEVQSQGVALAKDYMSRYYPTWYGKFPRCDVESKYLYHYSCMRWDLSGDQLLSDPDGLSKMDAEHVLAEIFKK